jgi:predicted TIM-barrel fold metal-dependent hydrolase
MFGTDNPFFPPKEGARSQAEWRSTSKNYDAIDGLGTAGSLRDDIVWGNASRILGIDMPKAIDPKREKVV